MTKTFKQILRNPQSHWVGDGFFVRSLFSYGGDTAAVSPFLLLDYGNPHVFAPNDTGRPRGVGQHPHRGFETVTIVYDGEVSHRDSHGGGGTIGPGDVQWMTAGAGVIHEEFHSQAFSEAGGAFRMCQLWVNLPKKDKMVHPRYQAIQSGDIPVVEFDGGSARLIAGELNGVQGAASTFTPMNIWDVKLSRAGDISLNIPEGHNTLLLVMSGYIEANGYRVNEGEIARYSVEGEGVSFVAGEGTVLLVLTGEPIDEPVVGHGPFVMNSVQEIHQAISDFQSGRFGGIPD